MARSRAGSREPTRAGASSRFRGWRNPSARFRVLAWQLVVVAVAMLGSVLVSRHLLLADVNTQLNAELTHEADKFRAFAASDLDPTTGQPYQRIEDLFRRYLQRNLPEDGETFFSLVDGRPDQRSPGEPSARLDLDPAFIEHLRTFTTPTSGVWQTSAGEAAYALLPIELAGSPPGALVVIEFRQTLLARADHAIGLLLLAALASLVAAGFIGWVVAGRVLAPVRAMRRTAERISGSDLSDRIAITGNDDVAALARTFNTMLDRLESAFTGQRQFLDDAGHELRTPITIIRGNLELMGTDPSEQESTRALVLDELDRMSRIVNDLLLLAKAEQPDFLTVAPVDLADLTIDALAKAKALGDRHWRLDEFAERTVLADGQRLTQALMQLAANAVRHTRPGDTIAIGTAVSDQSARPERLRLWVRDTGCGIADGDRERLFDRFYRGTGTAEPGAEPNSRLEDGAGLGLTIVARIAAAHHGRVEVESAPGSGAKFTLDLPLMTSELARPDADQGVRPSRKAQP